VARVAGEIVIQRPVEDVFDFVANERNEPRYNPRMLTAELISGEPIGVGSRFRAELQAPGRTMPMTIEFTEFDRPYRLASSTRSSIMSTVGALTFEPVPDGTRMRWTWHVEPHGILFCCRQSSASSAAGRSNGSGEASSACWSSRSSLGWRPDQRRRPSHSQVDRCRTTVTVCLVARESLSRMQVSLRRPEVVGR
jgi:uncharacterized protein YndB with AHSA1/START domain